jgi:hypothetical protein
MGARFLTAIYAAIVLSVVTVTAASAANFCTCEDRDHDGSFGVWVHSGGGGDARALKPNIGRFGDCWSERSKQNACKQATNYCACEDRNRDGRFGIWLYRGVDRGSSSSIRPNEGDYANCLKSKGKLRICNQ